MLLYKSHWSISLLMYQYSTSWWITAHYFVLGSNHHRLAPNSTSRVSIELSEPDFHWSESPLKLLFLSLLFECDLRSSNSILYNLSNLLFILYFRTMHHRGPKRGETVPLTSSSQEGASKKKRGRKRKAFMHHRRSGPYLQGIHQRNQVFLN
jgi:hypothetical protein